MENSNRWENEPGNPVFIGEPIEVGYLKEPVFSKSPDCPDFLIWRNERLRVAEMLSEWKDFSRRGRMQRNMSPAHLKRALVTGSRGSGRFFFRVRTEKDRIFDLYYDRAVKDAVEREGEWILFREFV